MKERFSLASLNECKVCKKKGYYKFELCRGCRRVVCIKCDGKFMSKYRDNKICYPCTKKAASS